MGSRIGVYDLERIAVSCRGFERVTAVFGTNRALDDVRNFKKMLVEFAEDGGFESEQEFLVDDGGFGELNE